MESEFKLLKVKDNLCHFARVVVQAEPRGFRIEVLDQIRQPLNVGCGEVSRKHYADWIDAAAKERIDAPEILFGRKKLADVV